MGGILIRPPNPKNFRLRRAKKNRIFFLKFTEFFSRILSIFSIFWAKIFPPAAGKFHGFFVFTSVWRCFYHSWKYLTAAQARFLLFLRVQERASTIRKSICPLYMRGPVVFCEGRNAHLLFAKCICSRAVVVWVFTSVGTRVYHPQNVRESRTGVSEL